MSEVSLNNVRSVSEVSLVEIGNGATQKQQSQKVNIKQRMKMECMQE